MNYQIILINRITGDATLTQLKVFTREARKTQYALSTDQNIVVLMRVK